MLHVGLDLRRTRLDFHLLAIGDDIDLVVAADRCAVLLLTAFTTLFGDVGVAFEQVPSNVKAMDRCPEGRDPSWPENPGGLERQVRSAGQRCQTAAPYCDRAKGSIEGSEPERDENSPQAARTRRRSPKG